MIDRPEDLQRLSEWLAFLVLVLALVEGGETPS
jgi:hypothetical protein